MTRTTTSGSAACLSDSLAFSQWTDVLSEFYAVEIFELSPFTNDNVSPAVGTVACAKPASRVGDVVIDGSAC